MLESIANSILEADTRIASWVRQTPLQRSAYYSQWLQGEVYLKCENLQLTGSFKIRGAFNRLLCLSSAEAKRGVIAASTGNHGHAIAYAGQQLGIPTTIFAPQNASTRKLDSIRRYGGEVMLAGDDALTAETAAREHARSQNIIYVSPYNDPLVIHGQGTIGLEICRQSQQQGIGPIDGVFASLGGGGLVSGIGSYLKTALPNCAMIGCSPENSDVMIQSMDAGQIVEMESKPTLSDGSAGGIEPNAITFPLCQQLTTETHSVSEQEIASALSEFIDHHGMLIEGAAATTIAALKQNPQRWRGKTVVLVLCGANISTAMLRQALG